MVPTSLVGKFIKNDLGVFERGENLLKNGILHFVFRFSQLSEIALKDRIYVDEKSNFLRKKL